MAGERAPGQHGTTHFTYLLADEGGFVETADTLEEHLAQLGRTLHGDPQAETRRAFVQRFLRPKGVERAAGAELADAIERLAQLAQASCSRSSRSLFCTGPGSTSARMSAIFLAGRAVAEEVAAARSGPCAIWSRIASAISSRSCADLDQVRAAARGPAGACRR